MLASLLALPFLPAVLQIRPAELAAAPAVFDLLGRLTAIVGLTCLLLAAMLAVRVPGFDRLFGGLTRLWHLHHRLGGAALVLLLAHQGLWPRPQRRRLGARALRDRGTGRVALVRSKGRDDVCRRFAR